MLIQSEETKGELFDNCLNFKGSKEREKGLDTMLYGEVGNQIYCMSRDITWAPGGH